MPWVRFTAEFSFKPVPRVTQVFRAGAEKNVTRACAEAAIRAGKAVRIEGTKRKPACA